jgi:hypothetical protein
MFKGLTRAALAVGHLASHCQRMPKLFFGIRSTSYRAEAQKRKNVLSIVIDYLYLFFVLGMLPRNYMLWQFDTKKRSEFKWYMDEPDSPFLRWRLYSTLWDDAYSILVNDKCVFHSYCRFHQIPTPRLWGVFRDSRFVGERSQIFASVNRGEKKKYVIKPARGLQGKGIHFVPEDRIVTMLENSGDSSRETGGQSLGRGDFIVEEFIEQHRELSRINPNSVNTIRVITLLARDMSVFLLAAMLRTSSSEEGTDNFSTGGIVIGIDLDTGTLKDRGFLKPGLGTTLRAHPVTNTRFEGFKVPYWSEVKSLVTKAQSSFHHLKSVGWDIAIGQRGPILIEGNIEWGTAGIQAVNGGLLTERNRALFGQYGLIFRR